MKGTQDSVESKKNSVTLSERARAQNSHQRNPSLPDIRAALVFVPHLINKLPQSWRLQITNWLFYSSVHQKSKISINCAKIEVSPAHGPSGSSRRESIPCLFQVLTSWFVASSLQSLPQWSRCLYLPLIRIHVMAFRAIMSWIVSLKVHMLKY